MRGLRPMAWVASVLTMVWHGSSAQELTVIFDSGRTKPLAQLLRPLQSARRGGTPPAPAQPNLGAADLEQLLPITSPGLTPGDVIERAHEHLFTRPFFLVGSDARSREWLTRHRPQLMTIGAAGLLIEAATVEDLREMASIANGLPMTPASGSDIAKALSIAHYPVAISEGRIWQ